MRRSGWTRSVGRRPCVTVECVDGWLRVVRTGRVDGRRRITRIHVVRTAGDTVAPAVARALLAEAKCWSPGESLRVLVPTHAMFFVVNVPIAPPEEMSAMARWQAEQQLGSDGTFMCGAALEPRRMDGEAPTAGLSRVMVAAVSSTRLYAQVEPWLAAARGSCVATLGVFGLYQWAGRCLAALEREGESVAASTEGLSGGALVIDIGAFVARLLVVDAAGLAAAGDVSLSPEFDGSWFQALIREVKRLEFRYQEAAGATAPRPGRIVVTGLPHLARVVSAGWHEVDDRSCRTVSAWETIRPECVEHIASGPDLERQCPVALARVCGVALAEEEGLTDLVAEEWLMERAVAQSRATLRRTALCAALAFVVAVGGSAWQAAAWQHRLVSLQRRAALSDARLRLARQGAESQAELARRLAALPDVLLLMDGALRSAPPSVELLDWSYEAASLQMRIRGVTGRVGTAVEWADTLQADPQIARATVQGARRRSDGPSEPQQAAVEFVIVCEVRRRGEAMDRGGGDAASILGS